MPQEIKKIPIVIASILKPVDDTRMMEKLAATAGKIDNTSITIIGYPTNGTTFSPEITYKPYSTFGRLSVGRWLARLSFFNQVRTIQPSIIIITTHELLFTSLLAKWITGCRIVYDVQENYYRNICQSKTFPPLLKQLVAAIVRLKEILVSPAVDHFLLAEASYKTELAFIAKRFTVMENKVSRKAMQPYLLTPKLKTDQRIRLLFSGTLATGTGVFEAIRWTKLMHEVNRHIHLTIIGYCAIPDDHEKIINEIAHSPYISLIGGNHLVPHAEILKTIRDSDAGFITYRINPSVSGAIPTKLFEYMAFQLPILIVPHPPWIDYCKPWSAAIELDENRKPEEILNRLQTGSFYTETPENIFWEDQEEALITVIRKVV